MQNNYRSRCFVVIDGDVYVHKYEKCKFDQTFISFQSKYFLIGKSNVCAMTEFFGAAYNSSDFDVKTFLLQCENNEYVYISGLEIFESKTDDKIIDYLPLVGNKKVPYAILLGEEYTYFFYNRYKFFKNDKIEEGTLLNTIYGSSDPYDYHVEKCGIDAFNKLEHVQIHTFYPHEEDGENEDDDLVEEDEENEALIETIYTNGNKQMVKIFNQKCVICLERDSVYAFRQCGHQCTCEQCYENIGDNDMLKRVVCRT